MTEQEYINTKALGTITSAIHTLRDIVPANLPDAVNAKDFGKAMGCLCDIRDKLFELINIEDIPTN